SFRRIGPDKFRKNGFTSFPVQKSAILFSQGQKVALRRLHAGEAKSRPFSSLPRPRPLRRNRNTAQFETTTRTSSIPRRLSEGRFTRVPIFAGNSRTFRTLRSSYLVLPENWSGQVPQEWLYFFPGPEECNSIFARAKGCFAQAARRRGKIASVQFSSPSSSSSS